LQDNSIHEENKTHWHLFFILLRSKRKGTLLLALDFPCQKHNGCTRPQTKHSSFILKKHTLLGIFFPIFCQEPLGTKPCIASSKNLQPTNHKSLNCTHSKTDWNIASRTVKTSKIQKEPILPCHQNNTAGHDFLPQK
jgi:hypothetical protein